MKPRIFISAVSKELKTARQLAANTLLALGFEPVWQDLFETHSGDIRPMLREKLDSCSALLQIVGDAYGAEPPAADEKFGRVSYTQYEALYAKSRGKKVYYLIAEADLPRDAPPDQLDLPRDDSPAAREDSAERRRLQAVYRTQVQSTEHLFYAVQSHEGTELTVRRLKNELEKLRRWFLGWMAGISAALVLIVAGVLWLGRGQQVQQQNLATQSQAVAETKQQIDEQAAKLALLERQTNNPERTREQLQQTILKTYDQAVAEADRLTDWRKRKAAKEFAVAQREQNLARVDEFLREIVATLESGGAAPEYLELTRIFNEQGAAVAIAYISAEQEQLLSQWDRRQAQDRQRLLLPLLQAARYESLQGNLEAARNRCDAILKRDPLWGDALHERYVILTRLGDQAQQYESISAAETAYQSAAQTAQRLAELQPPHPKGQVVLAHSHKRLGTVLRQLGRLQEALGHFESGHKISAQLVAADPSDAFLQRELGQAHLWIGKLCYQLGRLPTAVGHYEASLKINQQVAAADAGNPQAARDVSTGHNYLGDALLRQGQLEQALHQYGESLKICQKLAQADAQNLVALDDLGVAYQRLGALLLDLGQPEEARGHIQEQLAISQRVAAADPRDLQAQRNLTIALEKSGDLLLALDDLPAAEKQYQESLTLSAKLAAADSRDARAQRDLSYSYDRIGDLLVEKDRAEAALRYYENGLAIRLKLAETDAQDLRAQRDLSMSYDALGLTESRLDRLPQARGHFEQSLALRTKLAAAAENDSRAQRDLSLAHQRLGDLSRREGQFEPARLHFQASFTIAAALAERTEKDLELQRDLALAHGDLGDILRLLEQTPTALTHWEVGLAIYQKLAADEQNLKAQRDLARAHERLGDAHRELNLPQRALAHYQACGEVQAKLALAPRGNRGTVFSAAEEELDTLLETSGVEQVLSSLEKQFTSASSSEREAWEACEQVSGYFKLGRTHFLLGDFPPAKAALQEGLQVLDRMLADKRNAPSALRDQRLLREWFSRCESAILATGDLEPLLQLPPEQRSRLLSLRCEELAKRRRTAEVARAAAELVTAAAQVEKKPTGLAALFAKDSRTQEVVYFDAARGYGLCLKLSDGWPGHGPFPPPGGEAAGTAEEMKARQEFQTQAIAALRAAIAAGWNDFELLREHPDLAALRGQPEFEALGDKSGKK